jgi:hypothetical protein
MQDLPLEAVGGGVQKLVGIVKQQEETVAYAKEVVKSGVIGGLLEVLTSTNEEEDLGCGEQTAMEIIAGIDISQIMLKVGERFLDVVEGRINASGDESESLMDSLASVLDPTILQDVAREGERAIKRVECQLESAGSRRRLGEGDSMLDAIHGFFKTQFHKGGISIQFSVDQDFGGGMCFKSKSCTKVSMVLTTFSLNIPFKEPKHFFLKWKTGFGLEFFHYKYAKDVPPSRPFLGTNGE